MPIGIFKKKVSTCKQSIIYIAVATFFCFSMQITLFISSKLSEGGQRPIRYPSQVAKLVGFKQVMEHWMAATKREQKQLNLFAQ